MTTERTQELTNEIGVLHQALVATTSIDGQAKKALLNQVKRIEALALGTEILFPAKLPAVPPTLDISKVEPGPVLPPPMVEPVVTAGPVQAEPKPVPPAHAKTATPAEKPTENWKR